MQRIDQLWYHATWATKHHEGVLNRAHMLLIRETCKRREGEWQFDLDAVGGTEDHVHILLRIHPSQPVARVIGWIKGSTSHALGDGFTWQSGYVVNTVSPELLPEARSYVHDQVSIHTSGTIRPEWELPE